MASVGVLRTMGVAMAGMEEIDKMIVKTCKGEATEEMKQKVLSYFGKEHLKKFKFRRPEKVKEESIETFYYPIHLAIIYNNDEILEIFYNEMEEDKDYFNEVLNLGIETSVTDFDVDKVYPDEVCGLTPLFLAVKYNAKALSRFLKIAAKHQIPMTDVLKSQQEKRGYNLLQFATFNKTLECMR